MADRDFWSALARLIAMRALCVDRPKGLPHPHYLSVIYPLDYGFLEGTASGDSGGIDVWIGGLPERRVTGIVRAVDQEKLAAEIKILFRCTADEARQVLEFHNRGNQSAVLMERTRGCRR